MLITTRATLQLNHISKRYGTVSCDEEESPVTPPKSAGNFFPTVRILS